MQRFLAFIFALGALVACKNNCKQLDCKNGGSCYNGACICAKWYSGDECQLQYNRNYEGSYSGHYSEAARSATETLEVTADERIPNRMMLPSGIYFEFTDESNLLIPKQQLMEASDTLVVEGKGSYSTTTLSFSYEKNPGPGSHGPAAEVVSFSGTRVE